MGSPLTVGVTLGDPAGVGAEIVARALADSGGPSGFRVVVLGSEAALRSACDRLGLRLDFRPIGSLEEAGDGISLLSAGPDRAFEPGKPSIETGRAALAAVDRGLELALSGRIQALATAPVSKRHIAESGVPFVGHTEYLAARAHVKHVVMFFTSERLKVGLVTTHAPIKKVSSLITVERILSTIALTEECLRRHFGILEPRLAVSGLNPHAGEGGQCGREEIDVIAPAVDAARRKGHRVTGPLPGDTIFRRVMDGHFDAAISMYHDQALGPVKTLARDATNVTLGLPFIRTSVDHGTAFDIAGTGRADAAPMAACLRVACEMARASTPLL